MNSVPDDLLISIFSRLDLRDKIKCESVSRKWRRILLNKCFRKLGTINLNYLFGDNLNWELRLPHAIIHLLVVQQRRIFEGIVVEFQNTHALISVMQTITSAQAQYVKHLEITRKISTARDAEIQISDLNRLCELVSLCANLEVLKIDLSRVKQLANYHRLDVDLSQLMHLKVLKGNRVNFINFQAPNLVELEYKGVRLYDHDRTDFRLMLITISSGIEVLNLDDVRFPDDLFVDDDVVLQMPMLRQLSFRSNYIAGFTFNLSESTCLDRLVVGDQSSVKIINFDLSVHSLSRFDVDIARYCEHYLVDQFIISALRHPDCFCLLKELDINVNRNSLGNDLFNSISPLNIYSFINVRFVCVDITENLMTSNLVVLVDCSPALETIIEPNFVLDKKCLIDIIISRMRIVDIDFYFEFCNIDCDYNELAVLSDVYDALNDLEAFTGKRHCDIKVKVNWVSVTVTKEFNDMVTKIAEHFRVFFTFRILSSDLSNWPDVFVINKHCF